MTEKRHEESMKNTAFFTSDKLVEKLFQKIQLVKSPALNDY